MTVKLLNETELTCGICGETVPRDTLKTVIVGEVYHPACDAHATHVIIQKIPPYLEPYGWPDQELVFRPPSALLAALPSPAAAAPQSP